MTQNVSNQQPGTEILINNDIHSNMFHLLCMIILTDLIIVGAIRASTNVCMVNQFLLDSYVHNYCVI